MAPTARLRIGLLIDRRLVNQWVNRLAGRLAARRDIDLQILVCNSAATSKIGGGRRGAPNSFHAAIFSFVTKIELSIVRVLSSYRLLAAGGEYLQFFTAVDEPASTSDGEAINLADGGSWSEDSIASVEQLRLDLLVQCGTPALARQISSCARLGILRLRYGDRIAGPPGFWETYYRGDFVDCSLERLPRRADGEVETLVRATFATKPLYTLTQAHLYAKGLDLLARIIEADAGARTVSIPTRGSSQADPSCSTEIAFPRYHQSIFYLIKMTYRLAKLGLFRLVGLKQRWSISILENTWEKARLPAGRSLRPPPGRFWADPFLYVSGHGTFCFVEEFFYETGKGHIAALQVIGSTVRECGPVLVEPFHLSFPFIFEYDGNIYMCPECAATRTITVYRCVDFPAVWSVARTLMRDISAVDTMIFSKDGKWWMLTNIDYTGLGDYGSDLYLFYADTPLADKWSPHPQNPVKIDSRGGRNGGLILQADKIFRVGQRQSFGRYGGGVLVFEIEALSESLYVENLVREISVSSASCLSGTHHLSSISGITAIDHFGWELVRARRASQLVRTARAI